MRMAAFAGLAVALALAAVVLVMGGSPAALAQGPSQAVDDVQVELVNNNQPETLFPAEVLSGTTVVVQGTRSVSGQVRYNIRGENGAPSATSARVYILDPVGLQVYSDTFQTQGTPYTGYLSRPFTATGDQMFTVYRATASSGVQSTLGLANSIASVTTVTSDTLNIVSRIGNTASDANRGVDRLLAYTEVPTPTKASLTSTLTELRTVATTANAVLQAGANQGQFIANRDRIVQAAQNASTAMNAALPGLTGLSNLKIPVIDGCNQDAQGRAIQRTYSAVVSAVPPGNPTAGYQVRDTWEWQVGNPSSILAYADLVVDPPQIYTLDVSASTVHTATVRAALLDIQCLPAPDNLNVIFRSTIGVIDPVTVTTRSAAGEHGLAQTTLRAGNILGVGLVSISNLIGAPASTNATVIGPADELTFLSPSGEQQNTARYIRAGDQNVQLQVQVRDEQGSIVANGTQVRFTVTNNAGTFSQETVATTNGLALATFRAGSNLGSAVVTAQAVGTSAQATLNLIIVGAPARVTLSVQTGYSSTLILGGAEPPQANYTFVEATVSDAANQPVADGTQVRLQLTAARKVVWENSEPNSEVATLVTTTAGKARAKLTAPDTVLGANQQVVRNTPGTVNVLGFIPGAPVPPSSPLTITVVERVTTTTYYIYLPSVYRSVRCRGECTGPLLVGPVQ